VGTTVQKITEVRMDKVMFIRNLETAQLLATLRAEPWSIRAVLTFSDIIA
jgi:hypothetical protein